MSRRARRLAVGAACLLASAGGLAAGPAGLAGAAVAASRPEPDAARAAAAPRPTLVVLRGSVARSGTRLVGTVVVRNAGRHTARGAAVALSLHRGHDARVLRHLPVAPLRAGRSRTVAVRVALPRGLAAGRYAIRACAGPRCRTIGHLRPPAAAAPAAPGAPAPSPPGTPAPGVPPLLPPGPPSPPAPPDTPPASSVPTAPVAYEVDAPLPLTSAQAPYTVTVPASYDRSGQTPIELLLWMHGCGGSGPGDVYTVSPGGAAQHWIAASIGGRDGECWQMGTDDDKVLGVLADVETHFNVAPRRVVLGGYSSGGDLAYRTAFLHAASFAGVLAINTSPFRDTGLSQETALASAAWRFPVVHVAHLDDDTYPIDGVQRETDALATAGFPVTRIERPGHHWDDPGAYPGTDADIQTYLLPHLDDGWQAPAPAPAP